MILCHTNMIIQSMLVLILRFIAETYSSGLVFSMYQLQQISSNKYNHLSDSDPTSNPESSQNQQMTINNSPSKTVICQTFSLHQRKLCHQHFRLMESVVNGFLLGLNECQFQFADQIWNCKGHNVTIGGHRTKSKPRKKGKTYLDKLVSKSTPEAAYVSSVISAGVAHQVTKACSKGVHDSCGCDRTIYDTPESERFKWSGCSHNIHFGAAFTRQFLDVPDKIRVSKKPEKALTKLHNNHVGRQAVIMKMAKKCKCHGVSGSCEMKTCIRALPDFRVVGDLLKSRFHKAMQVHFVDSRLIPRYWPSRMFTDNDLIYLLKSPNYCVHNPHFGSLGTQGRKCAESSLLEKKPEETRGSCEELCCGRGHKKRTFSRVEQCHCKFHWCCDVKCDQCRKDVIEAVCD